MEQTNFEYADVLVTIAFAILVVIGMVVYVISDIQDSEETIEKYGKYISKAERACYDFCDGYYYYSTSMVGADTCNCGEVKNGTKGMD